MSKEILNSNQGLAICTYEERRGNMSFNYLSLNKDFVILGSDSRESFWMELLRITDKKPLLIEI